MHESRIQTKRDWKRFCLISKHISVDFETSVESKPWTLRSFFSEKINYSDGTVTAQTEYMATRARSDIIHILNVPFPDDTNFYYRHPKTKIFLCALARRKNFRLFSSLAENYLWRSSAMPSSCVGVYLSDYCQLGVIRSVFFSERKPFW